MNELQIITIDGVDCYEKGGIAYLKLENVARGLGFTQEKNGVEYVRWDRVEQYLREVGFPTSGENEENTVTIRDGKCDSGNSVAIRDGITDNIDLNKPINSKSDSFINRAMQGTYIPEHIFYRLAMKASNDVARAFQEKIANEIIPAIRKQGYYSTYDSDEELIAAIVRNVEDENKLPTVIKALRLANIDQGLFTAQLTGMTANEYGRCKALLDRSDKNDVAKRRMKRWEHYGQRIYTRDDLPEKYRESVYIGSLIEELSKKHENGDFFVNYCGKIYFNAYGYRAILKKLLRNKLITEDEKMAIEREADVL